MRRHPQVLWIAPLALLALDGPVLAYDPPPGSARNDFGAALIVCGPYIKAHKSPGEVSEADYVDYVEKRDSALAADPKLKEWDQPMLVRFDHVEHKNPGNAIIFIDLQTGRPVTKADDY